tara:strand:- start:1662 stop:2057 length:396 start_codon:yes stop_codon:yes gene_type:complete
MNKFKILVKSLFQKGMLPSDYYVNSLITTDETPSNQLIQAAVMKRNFIEYVVLHIPFFWYLEAEWGCSKEMDYTRKPRRFYRNKFFKEYIITEVFTYKSKVKPKNKLVMEFCKELRRNDLLMDRTYLIYSE